MPTLTVTPNPAPPSTLVDVAGSGFPNAKTRLLLDGVGATTNIFRPHKDGTFNVGITVAPTAKTQTLVAQQLSGSTWTDKASVSIVVQTPVVTPPPPPPTRPFPAPVTSQTVNVPASIDATGATDVAAALNAWVASVPNGSILNFPATATYRLSLGITFRDRQNLVFAGNGCTLKSVFSANPGQYQSPFLLGKAFGAPFGGLNQNIAIKDFVLTGDYPTPGVYSSSREGQAGVSCVNSRFVEITGLTVSRLGGDGVMPQASEDVWIHHNRVVNAGRMGVAVISGSRVLIEDNQFDDMGYYVLDLEPNKDTEACTFITFRNNVCQSWGPDVGSGAGFVAALSGLFYLAGTDIVISGNRLTGSSNATLRTFFNQNQHRRLQRITFSDNTSAQAGGVVEFKSVDGLTVQRNLAAGVPVQLSLIGCTGVVQ